MSEEGLQGTMLLGEVIIAEIFGGVLLGYTAVKHVRGGEGYALAAIIASFVLLIAVPITAHFVS